MPNIEYDSYDERDALIDYIIDSDLMTPNEELASEAMIARIQAEGLRKDGNDAAAADLLEQRRLMANEAVNQLLEGGDFAFQSRMVDRVIAEEQSGILRVVNRCPNCAKVVRTKNAKQCLWCGHDWH
jgi:hypothetical protein